MTQAGNEVFEGEVDAGEVVALTNVESVTRAEVDIQIATAHHYPRSVRKAKAEMIAMATIDEDTAASCMYSVPREGKHIQGPSARMAEIIAQCWGNIRVVSRVTDDDGKFIVCESVCHDLERNYVSGSQVRRRVTTKTGKRYSDDMIVTTANAACSIAARNAVLKVVPKVIWKQAFDASREITTGNAETLTNRRAKLLDYFQKLGVNPDRVCAAVNHTAPEEITLDDIAALRGMATAIREEGADIDELFPGPNAKETPANRPAASRTDALNQKMASNSAKTDAPKPEPTTREHAGKAQAEKLAEALKETPGAPTAAPAPTAPPAAPNQAPAPTVDPEQAAAESHRVLEVQAEEFAAGMKIAKDAEKFLAKIAPSELESAKAMCGIASITGQSIDVLRPLVYGVKLSQLEKSAK